MNNNDTSDDTDSEAVRRVLLGRLGVLVGEWTERVELPGSPAGRMSFEWTLDGQYLLARSEIPDPNYSAELPLAQGVTFG